MGRIIGNSFFNTQDTDNSDIEATNVTTTVEETEARIIMKENLFYIVTVF